MLSFFKKILGIDRLSYFQSILEEINKKEEEVRKFSDKQLKEAFLKLREDFNISLKNDLKNRRELLIKSFSYTREAAKRTLGQRPFNSQIIGGLVLDSGAIAEMATGEGKTLSAVLSAVFNSLYGRGVHIVTVNDYLAKRDAVWMGQIYNFFGLSVSCITSEGAFLYDPDYIPKEGEKMADIERDTTGNFLVQTEYLRPISRHQAYLSDITYGTNQEFGFDYLRDNLAYQLESQSQREHFYAIIDEVDSVLIDEARTPLIIAAPSFSSQDAYRQFAKLVNFLTKDVDYVVDEKFKTVNINSSGINKVESMMKISNLYDPANIRLVRFLEESLKAKELFKRDKDYVVKNGEVIIVDEFTGHLLFGRRYTGGLHQAIEAKEGLAIKDENQIYAQISIQNYFRMYKKISGMTGTAQTSAEEFFKVYNLEVISIPTNRPMIRRDYPDKIYKDLNSKWRAILAEIKTRHQKGQPILIGTASIKNNEFLSNLLSKENIPHEILNAKNNEKEGAIIAQAGKLGKITVATNIAGRGVDIILGGNPPNKEEAEEVKKLGGLFVLGTERHESRRIDNQLRGRSGRQGDPGESQFFLSLEDDLMRIFGGDKIKNLVEKLNIPEDTPIQSRFVSNAVLEAQKKIEGFNFDIRKNLLDYDDVLNRQRLAIYKKRQQILTALNKEELKKIIYDLAENYFKTIQEQPLDELVKIFKEAGIINQSRTLPENFNVQDLREILMEASLESASNFQSKNQLISFLDFLWLNHLEDLESLREGIGLRSYGQRDPLVEYRKEAHLLYNQLLFNFSQLVFQNIFKITNPAKVNISSAQKEEKNSPHITSPTSNNSVNFPAGKKIGRNDPCPCGSGKKYKKCHGKNI